MTDENVAIGNHTDEYLALCGHRVWASPLAAPVGRPCGRCTAVSAAAQPIILPASRHPGWLWRILHLDGSNTIRESPYYCGWTIVRRDALSHFIASWDFPIVGSSHRAWCGATVIVIGLILNIRRLRLHCAECNQRLKQIATTPDPQSG
jgi:hypothetical protein